MSAGVRMKREIVIEIEQIRRIRKRTASQVRYCIECRCHTDFVSLRRASELFEHNDDELLRFVRNAGCHTQTHAAEIFICLIALLDAMKTRTIDSRFKLIGEGSL